MDAKFEGLRWPVQVQPIATAGWQKHCLICFFPLMTNAGTVVGHTAQVTIAVLLRLLSLSTRNSTLSGKDSSFARLNQH